MNYLFLFLSNEYCSSGHDLNLSPSRIAVFCSNHSATTAGFIAYFFSGKKDEKGKKKEKTMFENGQKKYREQLSVVGSTRKGTTSLPLSTFDRKLFDSATFDRN